MQGAPIGRWARERGLRRIAAVLADIALPNGLPVGAIDRLRVPLTIATGTLALAGLLTTLALVDLARLLAGAPSVAISLACGVLALPTARLMLGVPSGAMAALIRASPLLRAIELGDSLGRAWRATALLCLIGPICAIGAAGALVLVARGEAALGILVVTASAVGAVAGWFATRSGARAFRSCSHPRAAPWRALAQAALVVVIAVGAAVAAPLLPPGMRSIPGTLVVAAALAAAVHVAGELLAVDARVALGLARSLVGCGASPWRLASAVTCSAAGCALLVGAAAAVAVDALSGTRQLGALAGFGVAYVITSAVSVMLARPAASDVVPRVLLLAVALVPAGLALAAGSWVVLATTTVVALAAVGGITVRRLA